MTRRTAVSAPAQFPDIEALVGAVGGWSLLELSRLSARLEELILAKRLQSQQRPSPSRKKT